MMMRNLVVLWLATTALGESQIPWSVPPPEPTRFYVHILNGLTNLSLDVHCRSKDDDLQYHRLFKHGDDYQWSFNQNIWGTTLFWCRLDKSDAYVSFESFWPESWKNTWLRDRCGPQLTCIWTAKDDGIYLRNMPTNADEFVHKWIPK